MSRPTQHASSAADARNARPFVDPGSVGWRASGRELCQVVGRDWSSNPDDLEDALDTTFRAVAICSGPTS